MASLFINKTFRLSTCQFIFRGAPLGRKAKVPACFSVRHHSMTVKYAVVVRKKLLDRCCSTSITASRNLSTADKTGTEDYIPAPPVPPAPENTIDVASDPVVSALSQLEPTLSSQGLGGWSPIGLLQHGLEWIHVSAGMPWWATISIATLLARFLLFPLFVKSQTNATLLHNIMPEMQTIQMKVTEARQNGNQLEAAKLSHELMELMKEKKCNPLKSIIVTLVQAPVFISFFIGLRRMANLPVESFKQGGLFWFTDLTIADPYYLLPIMTCVTLFISIEIGAEGGLRMDQLQTARYLIRAVPLVMFPFIMNFPSAILCYWLTTNGVTLFQIALLKSTKIREFLNVPIRVEHSKQDLPMKKKGVVDSFKDSWNNNKVTREMADRMQRDQRNFTRAGMGPVPKTYKFDPTKQKSL